MDIEQLLGWAEGHAETLTNEMFWVNSEYGGYWSADGQAKGRIRARVTAALAFLEQFSGTGSRWSQSAHDVFDNKCENQSMESGARAVGDVIMEWAHMVRCGQVNPRLESFSVRAASSTDLLEQVRALNENKAVVPAAPIVLAGAALEIALRSAVEELDLAISGRSGINTYAAVLRCADVLNKQDMKDVTQMAGLRNSAAHGEHDLLSRRGASLMEQQVNVFLDRLEQTVQQSAD